MDCILLLISKNRFCLQLFIQLVLAFCLIPEIDRITTLDSFRFREIIYLFVGVNRGCIKIQLLTTKTNNVFLLFVIFGI